MVHSALLGHHLMMALSTNPVSQESRKSPWKNPFVYSGAVLVCVAIYVGFVLLTRYASNRAFARPDAAQIAEKWREEDRQDATRLRISDLAIRSFRGSHSQIHPGENTTLSSSVA